MESTTETSNLEPGTRLAGRYRIESILGQGGMGAVYLGRLEALGEKAVAIKEMRIAARGDKAQQQAVEQFQQEARFLAHLEHPNLVQVSDYFTEGGRHYLVMAYIKGQTLAEMLQARKGAFPVARVLEWGRQLASVLTYLHKQTPPIIFRDLKPSNIMLDNSGTVRLIDFGIARAFDPEGVTATFLQGVGSAGYSPLEQYQGAGGTDPRSDIYSLGATMFHLLTNRMPPSPVELVTENKPMPSPLRWNPTLPKALEPILAKMMAIRKDERYSSMEQVQGLLDNLARSLEQDARDPDVTEPLGGAPHLPPPSSTALANAPTLVVQGAPPTAPIADPNEKYIWLTMGTLVVALIGFFGWVAMQGKSNSLSPSQVVSSPSVVPVPSLQSPTPAPVAAVPPRPARPRSAPLPTPSSRPARPRPQASPPRPAPLPEPPLASPGLPSTVPGQAYPTRVSAHRPPKVEPEGPPPEEIPSPEVETPTSPVAEPSGPGNSEFPRPKPGDAYQSYKGKTVPPIVPGRRPPMPDGKGGWMENPYAPEPPPPPPGGFNGPPAGF